MPSKNNMDNKNRESPPRIVVLCATHRGYVFLDKLFQLVPKAEVVVFSFREVPWEPPFLEKIRELVLAHKALFYEAKLVGDSKWESFWNTNHFDLMLAVSWRYLVPQKVYQHPVQGAYVFHDSLLPAYRGFSPTVWAILNNETQTGVTLFSMAEDVDSGDIVDQQMTLLQ